MRIEKLDSRIIAPQKRKLRAAAYVRVSTDKDAALDSLENQSETYAEQIMANPEWEFAGIYEDRGISGTKEMRPEFQRMLSDCRNGKIDIILTKSFTRFARNTVVLLKTLRELKSLNIEVVFEKDNIRSLSESGELLITLLAAFAQAESRSASENQNWRIKKAFEEGHLATGGRMLGYRYVEEKLVIIPEEAGTVRQIFTDYLSGMGKNAIAKKLNRQGIKTMNGGLWRNTTIHRMLTNEKYAGDMLLQKTFTDNYIDKHKKVNKGEKAKYMVEGSHEAIIPKEMFELVQAEIAKRSVKTAERKDTAEPNNNIFAGIVYCGRCKSHYQRRRSHPGSKYEKMIWSCYTYCTLGKDLCSNRSIPEDILYEKAAELLGADCLPEKVRQQIREIWVLNDGNLHFIFNDGNEKMLAWKNRPRGDSWTEEMRQKARERARARIRKEDENV